MVTPEAASRCATGNVKSQDVGDVTIRSISGSFPRVTPYLAIDGAAAAIDF